MGPRVFHLAMAAAPSSSVILSKPLAESARHPRCFSLARYPQLADLLGQRHGSSPTTGSPQSPAADRPAPSRAADLLDGLDFTPAAMREDLRTLARYLFSVSELVDRAVDLTTQSAALVHDNERRWRVFPERAEAVRTDTSAG